jgi:hypothetical protein
MTIAVNNISRFWILTPLFGIILFLVLYVTATKYYPGGSQADHYAAGFSWINNYWCNLLNENAINGQANHARPIAMLASGILAASLVIFWIIFSMYSGFSPVSRMIIQASGIISMVLVMFLFSSYHDMVVNLATAAGLVPLTATFIGLYRLRWKMLFWMGLLSLVLVALNSVLYYGDMLRFLPLVQKFSFLYFLCWFCFIIIKMNAGIEKQDKPHINIMI